MEYAHAFRSLEAKWQQHWQQSQLMAFDPRSSKPKYYVLDMFPYPSGAGLHVGHPLGYVATDIVARYRKMLGYEVLHPMGYDAFGLPAENYAIQTGQHPALTTEQNVATYRRQLDMLGLVHTPGSDIRTCDPDYYRWTQWIFLQLFAHWYDTQRQQARPIAELEAHFATQGSTGLAAATDSEEAFTAAQWHAYTPAEKEARLQRYRLAYQSETLVNWCPALGTVLANEEVKDGLSERGGHPVERKPMRQWSLRITAYAERLLQGLEGLSWPGSILEMQRHWIGKSTGASVRFALEGQAESIEVFTTRPDTLWGVSCLVLAPEHPLARSLATPAQQAQVVAYIDQAAHRSERDRLADVKGVSGVYTGSQAQHPFTGQRLPIYLADYVLMGYGTGAIMAVPAHDSRDHRFAHHFGLPIRAVIHSDTDVQQQAYEAKTGTLHSSDFLNGLQVPQAIERVLHALEEKGLGTRRTTYRLRDAIFSRQRYWGEPIPIIYQDGIPTPVPVEQLPVTLPQVQSYRPTGTGQSPLAAVESWVNTPLGPRETDTMPGWAGSSWYFMRYVSPRNNTRFADELEKWLPVDLYVGGAEHAVGHLLYSRFWTHFLHDLGHSPVREPFRHLVNQGMIQGVSALVYKKKTEQVFVSADRVAQPDDYIALHVDVKLVEDDLLDVEAWRPTLAAAYPDAQIEYGAGGVFRVKRETEKMSKSLLNVVNPDDICRQYGADTFRLYEMFLGPLEQHKPWNTQGISGVYGFLKRVWSLCLDEHGAWAATPDAPTEAELKLLHQTIKKTREDIERLSFNTAVPQFMILVNELYKLKSCKQAVLLPFLQCLAPFAPHLAEELWQRAGQPGSIFASPFPQWEERYLQERSFEYPVSINGKLRFRLQLPLDLSPAQVEERVLAAEEIQKHLADGPAKKVIVVPGKIVNVVV